MVLQLKRGRKCTNLQKDKNAPIVIDGINTVLPPTEIYSYFVNAVLVHFKIGFKSKGIVMTSI